MPLPQISPEKSDANHEERPLTRPFPRRVMLLVLAAVFMESFSSVCMKVGNRYPFLSTPYILFYLLALLILATYAVAWQLLLEYLPLSTAYLRKGLSYILIYFWASLIFREVISPAQMAGTILIIGGMVVSFSGD